MKEAIREILREFYHDGVPDDIVPRDVDYAAKLSRISSSRFLMMPNF